MSIVMGLPNLTSPITVFHNTKKNFKDLPMHKIPKPQLIAAAESYAKVSPFADACYRYYFYHDKTARAYLTATLATEFAEHFAGIDAKYHANIICTALTEISYPTPIGKRFAFSERERAITARISRQTFRTHGMNTAVDNIISHITGIAKVVAGKVQEQLGRKFRAGY